MRSWTHTAIGALLLAALAAGAPGCGNDPPGGGGGMCNMRLATRIYYGTDFPEYAPLTPGQVMAIGQIGGGCSSTLIAPTWVLSATHCGLTPGDQWCTGSANDMFDGCIDIATVHENAGSTDMTIVELAEDATARFPGIEIIPINVEPLDDTWIGEPVETAGYGQTEMGSSGVRYFATEIISRFYDDMLTVDGEGTQGVCFGDSGGPVMIVATDGTVRVAGGLLGGDPSCVGMDNFTRTDVHADWIEERTGPTPTPGGGCGSITSEGRCFGETAVFCRGGELIRERCMGAEVCGFDMGRSAYRCITGADPCGGYDAAGGCDGEVAYWCDNGVLRSRDCATCGEGGQVCDMIPEVGGAYCRDITPCETGLDQYGRCTGGLLERCTRDVYESVDCAAAGLECGYLNADVGYACL